MHKLFRDKQGKQVEKYIFTNYEFILSMTGFVYLLIILIT